MDSINLVLIKSALSFKLKSIVKLLFLRLQLILTEDTLLSKFNLK